MNPRAPTRSLLPGLIINADDLGIHPNINAGIASAYREGVVTSCTMLMTTAYLETTVRDYVRPGVLPIGIHLSLTLGKAIAPRHKVSDLIDDENNLTPVASRLLLCSFSRERERQLLGQIACELEAQLSLAHDLGLRATHADSHQHVHMNPAIFSLVEDLLPRYGIDRLRYSREPLCFAAAADLLRMAISTNPAKWALLRWRSGQVQRRLATNDALFGVLYSGRMTKQAFAAVIASAPADHSLEICIHPGFPAPRHEATYKQPNYNDFICSPTRQIEHDILLDHEVGDLISRRGLALRAYDGRVKG